MASRKGAVIRLLSDGCMYSAIEISNRLKIGDARSAIRDIRKDGVIVSDIWKSARNGRGRYKLYFIKPDKL